MSLLSPHGEKPWRQGELLAKRWIEDHGYAVHDANILFGQNCPNIDLVVYGRNGALYVQTKWSERPAGRDCVVVDGSPWSEDQLFDGGAIFNRHDHFRANLILIVDRRAEGDTTFYVAPPDDLEALARVRGSKWALQPKRDGTRRSVKFRKELERTVLTQWRDASELLGEPIYPVADAPHSKSATA